MALTQSPFLNVLSDNQVTRTLKLMTLPVNSKLTPGKKRRKKNGHPNPEFDLRTEAYKRKSPV